MKSRLTLPQSLRRTAKGLRLLTLLWLLAAASAGAAAQTGGGLTASPAPGEAVVFGPQKYVRTSGPKNEYTVIVNVPAWVKSPYRMHIQNGGRDGSDRVVDAISSAWVEVNGVQVASPSDFNQNVDALNRSVTLTPTSTLKVTLASNPGSYLTIWFFGASADKTAPSVTIVEPAADLVSNDATPALRVQYGDDAAAGGPPASGVDPSTLRVTIDDVDRTSLFNRRANDAVAVVPDGLPLADGLHVMRVSVQDSAGNTGTATRQFRIDTQAPVVRLTSPSAGAYLRGALAEVAGTVTDATPVVVEVNDSPTIVSANAFTTSVPVADGPQVLLRATARDAAGNVGTAEVSVHVDSVAPEINVSEPAEGLITNQPTVPLKGTVSDASPFTLSLDGAAVAVVGGGFTRALSLAKEGLNTFTLSAVDAAGNSGTKELRVTSDVTAPRLAIASPAADDVVGNLPLVVRGLVQDATAAAVTVNGVPATLTEGAWEASLGSLPEGENDLSVVATDAAGNRTTLARKVVLDLLAPVVTISSPQPGTLTREATATVSGTVSDRSPASVSVNGIAGTLQPTGDATRRSFTVPNVPLKDGDNQLRVVATDAAGRAGEAAVVLTQDAIPPVVTLTTPENITRGRGAQAVASATDNLGIAQVVIKLNGATVGTFNAAPFASNLVVPAGVAAGETLTVTAEATDRAGNIAVATQTLRVIADGVIVGQVLSDATGLPVAGARVRVAGDDSRVALTDARGRYSLPAAESHLVLTIDKEGAGAAPLMSVEREVKVESGVGTVPVDARLTPLAEPTAVGAAGGTIEAGPVKVSVAAGAVAQNTSFRLTQLSAQGLPGLLPLGWSPVVAFDLRAGGALNAPLQATVGKLPAGAQHLAVYRPTVRGWMMVERDLQPADGSVEVSLPAPGTYAVVTADQEPPLPVPAVGQVLTGAEMRPLPETATSTSEVSPAILPPGGGTAKGKLAVQSPTPLPSGTVVQAEVTETFTLSTGDVASQEKRPQDIILYRNAAPAGSTLAAEFPIVPSRTFGASELVRGTVHLDILAGREGVRGKTGGSEAVTVSSGPATLTVAGGSLPQDTAVSLQTSALSSFLPGTPNLIPFAEVQVDFSGNTLRLPGELAVEAAGVGAGDTLLVARVERLEGVPRVMMVASADLIANRAVSRGVAGLPGVAADGRYVFYRSTKPLGFVAGTASAAARAVPGAVVQTDTLPFVSVTSDDGRYMLPAAAGPAAVSARVPSTSLQGTATAEVSAGQTSRLDLALAGVATTATVTPTGGATNVSVSTQVEITASAPLNAAALAGAEFKLYKGAAGSQEALALRPVLSGSGRVLALVPQARLEPATLYTLRAAGLTDIYGGLVSVPATAFTTKAEVPPSYDTNKLSFSFPDERGNVRVKAPAGSLPPGTTVLVVNAGNGVVISFTANNEGGIDGTLQATIDDRLLITISDPLGNVTNFERSQFVAEDGRVAIGPGGGTVEGPNGVELRIPSDALEKGAVFKIETFGPEQFPERPELPGAHFGGGLKITSPDKPTFKKEADLVFKKPADAPAGAFYYVYRRHSGPNGGSTFETIDHAFVEGQGADAKVVTASYPFVGHSHSLGEYQLDATAGTMAMIATPVTYEYLMWTDAVYGAGVALPGVITGKVLRTKWNPQATEPEFEGVPGVVVTRFEEDGRRVPQTIAVSQPDGTFALWDPKYTGGTVKIRATVDGIQKEVTAFEANPLDDRTFFTTLFQHYRNVASANITFPPQQPLPPAPKIDIEVMKLGPDGKRQDAGGIIISGTPLVIGFKSNAGSDLKIQSATVNGEQVAIRADSANDPRRVDFVLQDLYTPGDAGTYRVTATALPPLGGSPITVTNTFLVVAEGGRNTKAIQNAAPDVVTALLVPKDGQTGVPITVFPQVVFTEPVTHVLGNVRLKDPSGASVAATVSAVALDPQERPVPVANLADVDPTVPVTSITLQPAGGLRFGTTYTLELGSGIQDLDTDQNQAPAPKRLAPRSYTFTTYKPEPVGGTSENFGVAGIVVFGDRAYVGRERGTAPNGLLTVYDISDPALPTEVTDARRAVTGEVTDIAGDEHSPLTNGPLVAVTSGLGWVTQAPSNLYVFDVSEQDNPKRIAAVSLTESTQDGVIIRADVKDNFAYTITYPKGLQVIDLKAARSKYEEYEATADKRHERSLALVTGGQGFAQESVVNTIPVLDDAGRLGHLFGLRAGDYVVGGQSQTLVVATGSLPVVVANPQTGEIVHKTATVSGPALDYQGTLTFGSSVALGRLADKSVAVIVGRGTGYDPETNSVVPGPVLVVMDMTDPASPAPLSFLKLAETASDLRLNDTLALVGTQASTILVNLADPARPRVSGTLGGVGGQLALSTSNLLLSSLRGGVGGIGTTAFAPVSVIPFVDAVLVTPDDDGDADNNGSLQKERKVRVLKSFQIKPRVLPVVGNGPTQGILELRQKNVLVDAVNYSIDARGEVTAPINIAADRLFEDADLIAVATAIGPAGSFKSAPRRIKLGWINLTVDSNNNSVLDGEDDEAKRRGKAFAFWQSEAEFEAKAKHQLGEDVSDDASKGLADYATIRIRVNKEWWQNSPGVMRLKLAAAGQPLWSLAEKVAQGKEYLSTADGEQAQLDALVNPSPQCRETADAMKGECQSFMFDQTVTLPRLPVGEHEFLFRCAACAAAGPNDLKQLKVEYYEAAAAAASATMDEASVDIRPMEQWISAHSAWQPNPSALHPDSFRPLDKFHPTPGWAAIPEGAKKITVFVHGYNVPESGSWPFFKNYTKRLYWAGHQVLRRQGSDWRQPDDAAGCAKDCAQAVGLSWPGKVDPVSSIEFPPAEYRAFQSGLPMARFFFSLKEGHADRYVAVVAHSLGNLAVNNALRRPEIGGAFKVDKYLMNDAAVSHVAFDDSERPVPDAPLDKDTYPSWVGFFGNNPRRTVLYNTFNTTDVILNVAFNASRGAKPCGNGDPCLLDWAVAPPFKSEIGEEATEALWPGEGGDHSNVIYHWRSMAFLRNAGAWAAGATNPERFGAKNIDLTPYGRWRGLRRDPIGTDSHSYMMNYRFSEVWKAFEIFRDLLRP